MLHSAAHRGRRLDAFVAAAANGLTRSQAARYIEEGRVSVDGKPAAKSCRITGGEAVTVDVPEVRDTARVDVAALRAAGAHGVMVAGRVVQVVVGPSVDVLASDLEDLM